jgi:hypothetical protein
MSEIVDMLRKNGDNYVIASPIEGNSKVPFIDVVADTGE